VGSHAVGLLNDRREKSDSPEISKNAHRKNGKKEASAVEKKRH